MYGPGSTSGLLRTVVKRRLYMPAVVASTVSFASLNHLCSGRGSLRPVSCPSLKIFIPALT